MFNPTPNLDRLHLQIGIACTSTFGSLATASIRLQDPPTHDGWYHYLQVAWRYKWSKIGVASEPSELQVIRRRKWSNFGVASDPSAHESARRAGLQRKTGVSENFPRTIGSPIWEDCSESPANQRSLKLAFQSLWCICAYSLWLLRAILGLWPRACRS